MGTAFYFSHGGGPLPLMDDPGHRALISFFKGIPSAIEKPEAIVVFSAHWEEEIPTITGSQNPSLYYDYYGFPSETYKIDYPAPGNPLLSEKIKTLFDNSGIQSKIDTKRGLDHGVFVPLKLIYPEANIPVIQISLIKGLDAKAHIEMGQTIGSLLEENIMIIGSGFSFHNMRAFDNTGENVSDPKNDLFQEWLIDITTGEYSNQERVDQLIGWPNAPHSGYCHPREEHLLPVHLCCGIINGASGRDKKGIVIFDDYILGKRAVAVQWRAGSAGKGE